MDNQSTNSQNMHISKERTQPSHNSEEPEAEGQDALPGCVAAPISRPIHVARLPNGWGHLQDIDLETEYQSRCKTLRSVP
eukprot:7190818-Karenia_brevis.AAC.1